jgi:hypothetical protein
MQSDVGIFTLELQNKHCMQVYFLSPWLHIYITVPIYRRYVRCTVLRGKDKEHINYSEFCSQVTLYLA